MRFPVIPLIISFLVLSPLLYSDGFPFTPETSYIQTAAGFPGARGHVNSTGSLARFDRANSMCAFNGNLYVADSRNNEIRKVNISNGEVSPYLLISYPGFILTDGEYFYLVSPFRMIIRRVNIRSKQVEEMTISLTPAQKDEYKGSKGGALLLGDDIFFTDRDAHTVSSYSLTGGTVTRIAGVPFQKGNRDGPASSALFSTPIQITSNGNNILIGEQDNYTVRSINLENRSVSTILDNHDDNIGPVSCLEIKDSVLMYRTWTGRTLRAMDLISGEKMIISGSESAITASNGNGDSAAFYITRDMLMIGNILYTLDGGCIRKVSPDYSRRDTLVTRISTGLVKRGAIERFGYRVLNANRITRGFKTEPAPGVNQKIEIPPDAEHPCYADIGVGRSNIIRNYGIILDGSDPREIRLYFDGNANGNYLDDPPAEWNIRNYTYSDKRFQFTLEGSIQPEMPWPGNPKVYYRIFNHFKENEPVGLVNYHADYYRQADIELGGSSYDFFLFDLGEIGDFRGKSTFPPHTPSTGIHFAIDINSDGRINENTELFNIFEDFIIRGKRYRITEISPSGEELSISSVRPKE